VKENEGKGRSEEGIRVYVTNRDTQVTTEGLPDRVVGS